LRAILGDLDLVEGSASCKPGFHSSIAYVTQEPWIVNGSFRDNILFGKAFDVNNNKNIIMKLIRFA